MAREGGYHVVVGNPPYQDLSKTRQSGYGTETYRRGKTNLYAAFLERGLQLVREGGVSAMVTMRGWMFLGRFKALREHFLANFDVRSIGDFDRGAFDEVANEVLAVAAPVIRRAQNPGVPSVALQPTPFDDASYDRERTNRKRAAVLAQVGRHEFDPKDFEVIDGEPDIRIGSARYPASPSCYIQDYADSGVLLSLRYWIKTPYYMPRVRSKVNERVWDALEDAPVTIAYPHSHLVVDETSGRLGVDLDGASTGMDPEARPED
jgi:hypothetical protein